MTEGEEQDFDIIPIGIDDGAMIKELTHRIECMETEIVSLRGLVALQPQVDRVDREVKELRSSIEHINGMLKAVDAEKVNKLFETIKNEANIKKSKLNLAKYELEAMTKVINRDLTTLQGRVETLQKRVSKVEGNK